MSEDQEKILQDSKKRAKEFAYFMRKQLEVANLRGALKHSASMLDELKTSALSPKNYYALWMVIFSEMRELQKNFKEEAKRGRKMKELYASVQQSPSLIARLYLLITVGSVYIQSHEEGFQKILNDIIEMMRGVQNPLRGLYTRYYFLKICKDRLPDAGSEYEEEGYGVNEALEIIYTNLKESVFLWIRLTIGKDKSRKEKERDELKMLIGENLSRLSSLQGLTLQVYIDKVLPMIMELVSTAKDRMAQEYILDCVIQGFPEDFHIKTLSQLLELCANQLEKQVNVKTIFISLMDRLSAVASSSTDEVDVEQNIYQMFKQNILTLVEKSDSMEFKNVLKLQSSFLKFTIKCYPTNVQYVNQILSSAVATCAKNDDFDDQAQGIIGEFLTLPLEAMSVEILSMSDYPHLMKYLKFVRRREVALQIVKIVSKIKLQLVDEALVKSLLTYIEPLLKTGNDYVDTTELLFREEQTMVSKLIFLVRSDSPQEVWPILKLIIDELKHGGPTRLKYTYPSTLFRLFEFAKQVSSAQNFEPVKVFKKIFEMSKQLIAELQQVDPLLSLMLSLQFVLVINMLDKTETFDEFTYEIVSEVLQLYGVEATDSEVKMRYLKLIIGTVQQLQCISEENYNNLADNVTQYASKLLKKNEQAQMLLDCTHLFNNKKHKNLDRVSEIFRKCNKLAKTSYESSSKNLALFVEIVNKYAYFELEGMGKSDELQAAIEYFLEKFPEFQKEAQGDPALQAQVKYWERTRQYLKLKQNEGKVKLDQE